MKAMVLCAGEGTRLRPYTLAKPKPLIPFLGVPLVEHTLNYLSELSIESFVINHHHLGDTLKTYFMQNPPLGKTVQFSDESKKILGSGGAILAAKSWLDQGSFVVANGDELILPFQQGDLERASKHHAQNENLATLLVIENPHVGEKFGGAWTQGSQQVRRFSKTRVSDHKGWHYIGVIFLSPRIFEYLNGPLREVNLLYESLTLAIGKQEKVEVFPVQAKWFETGNPTDFKQATTEILDAFHENPQTPWLTPIKNVVLNRPLAPALVEADEPLLMQSLQGWIQRLKSSVR